MGRFASRTSKPLAVTGAVAQMLACRVIVSPTAHNVLPTYAKHTQRIEGFTVQEIKDFLDGSDLVLMRCSTHSLIFDCGFSLVDMGAALAAVKNDPRHRVAVRNEGILEAKRVGRNTRGYLLSELPISVKQPYSQRRTGQ
ncbi:hypothetical protein FVEG_17550 [Fusarium verticillioides 7600]|uniref:Uncharacterized protein n=1 Tax=Gibberella moniliformis (strain M3125 / FGSC 7600) TaxID=334819 RepID=W7NGN2_GIBM7|nr:hypothetical protein FVEG_17550 [Fusarium verticillioides 7600]EWG55562.1 hypothetical protein FVEG_17550 [Fusarium verticillioides 7600]